MRRIIAILTAVASLALAGFVIAPQASAASYGCSGTQIDSYPVTTNGGTQYATIYLYYDSATGTNCAVTVATSAGGYGTAEPTMAYITRCSGTTISSCQNQVNSFDQGNYQYYAGPVSINAAGYCIMVTGSREYNGVNAGEQSPVGHCG
ncbi:hypothetical protein [Streptomyces sp. RPT161]|uniref:hypothetical protein n=1 Tax=Streptomyces sp. RPT161 TaxID=3015993 RepID=UPI0022B8C1BE|nr:hypothetical protein [Streptomyces sp. RPT161]